MKVLFLADAVFADLPGGSRMVADALARGLTQRGHAVTFLAPRHTPDAAADEQRNGVRIVRYDGAGGAGKFVRAGRRAAANLWKAQPFDIVHTHFAYAALGPLAALPRATPHMRSFYGPWDLEGWAEDRAAATGAVGQVKARLKRAVRHQVEAVNLKRSDAVVVLSRQSRGEVREFGYPAARIHQSVGGVDTERFQPTPDKAAVRQKLGLPPECLIVLSVRRLAARMGLDVLIAAMPAVVQRYPHVLLLLGGQGPERARLEARVRAAGLESHVRLLGFIADDALAAYYQAADAFVLPTQSLEGFGLVTVEALSCGTPVVGTPVGATPEILGKLEPRLVTGAATADGLADGLLAFLDAPWRAMLTPARLHEFVRARYTWEHHVTAVENVYWALAGRPPVS